MRKCLLRIIVTLTYFLFTYVQIMQKEILFYFNKIVKFESDLNRYTCSNNSVTISGILVPMFRLHRRSRGYDWRITLVLFPDISLYDSMLSQSMLIFIFTVSMYHPSVKCENTWQMLPLPLASLREHRSFLTSCRILLEFWQVLKIFGWKWQRTFVS